MLLLSSFSETFFWGGKPPPKKAECLLGLPLSFSEGKRAQHEKRGEEGHPPPAHSQFRHMHSSPHLPMSIALKTRQCHELMTKGCS